MEKRLEQRVSEKLGFDSAYAVTGQTYPRKVDSQVLRVLAGIGETCANSEQTCDSCKT